MNIKNMMVGLSYSSESEYSSANNFIKKIFERIPNDIDIESSNIKNLLKLLKDQITNLSEDINEIDNKTALNILLSRDLEKIYKFIKNNTIPDLDKDLEEQYKKFLYIFMENGVDLSYTKFSIRDYFLPPYHKMDFWAMSYDVYDEKEFNIPIGVCLKKDHLAPFFSTSILGHELTHNVFGKIYYNYLARGLEDGICDFFGGLYLTNKIYKMKICKNILINSRFIYPRKQFWDIYTDSLRQAMLIYKYYGMDGIFNIFEMAQKEGRKTIKKIENDIISGNYKKLKYLRKGNWEDELICFSDFFLSYPYGLVVSPLARLIAENIRIGDKTEKILKELNINKKSGEKAIDELQNRVYLTLIDKRTVISDETKLYIKNSLLRYEI